MPDKLHFTKLTLENVRSFAGEQELDVSQVDGSPARWCLVVGENGVGKTTLMQALGAMRPKPGFGRSETGSDTANTQPADSKATEAPEPDFSEPEITEYENAQVLSFARHGDSVTARLVALFRSHEGEDIEIGLSVERQGDQLVSADHVPARFKLKSKGPLVIGYGASRHTGARNVASVTDTKPTAALFDETLELADAEEVLEKLDYRLLIAEREGRAKEAARLRAITGGLVNAIRAVIPDLDEDSEEGLGAGGSHVVEPGRGILLPTPSGLVALDCLSLGYRTVVAMVADLVLRLETHWPESDNPLEESAIVLIDEVDLHLHPRWQRKIRSDLLQHFPQIQFIVTSHSPIMAQESVAQGDPVAVVRWEGEQAVIINDVLAPRTWRFEEVVSEAFEVEPPVDTIATQKLRRRRSLLERRDQLSDAEQLELAELNDFVHGLQERGSTSGDDAIERMMARVKQLEMELAQRR